MKKRKIIIAGIAGLVGLAGYGVYRISSRYKVDITRVKDMAAKVNKDAPEELVEDALYHHCAKCPDFEDHAECAERFKNVDTCPTRRNLTFGYLDDDYLEHKSGKSNFMIGLARKGYELDREFQTLEDANDDYDFFNNPDYEEESEDDGDDETEDDLEFLDDGEELLDSDEDESDGMPEPGKLVRDFSGEPIVDISPSGEENPFKNVTDSGLGNGIPEEEEHEEEIEKQPMFFNPVNYWEDKFKDAKSQAVEDKINAMMRSPKDVFDGIEELPSKDIAQIVLKLSQLAEYPDTLAIALANPENYVALNFPNVDEKYKKYLVNFVKNLQDED